MVVSMRMFFSSSSSSLNLWCQQAMYSIVDLFAHLLVSEIFPRSNFTMSRWWGNMNSSAFMRILSLLVDYYYFSSFIPPMNIICIFHTNWENFISIYPFRLNVQQQMFYEICFNWMAVAVCVCACILNGSWSKSNFAQSYIATIITTRLRIWAFFICGFPTHNRISSDMISILVYDTHFR